MCIGLIKIKGILLKIHKLIKETGLKSTFSFVFQKVIFKYNEKHSYQRWIKIFEPTTNELDEQRVFSKRFPDKPLISILVPTYETNARMLIEMLESVIAQTYENWEICIADGGSKKEHVREILTKYSMKDKRIKVNFMEINQGIIGNSNEALKMCTGEYISLLDHDDTLAPFALYEIVKIINKENADFIYSDEDKINEMGTLRYAPYFKPGWSPDTIKSFNYITHFVTVRADILYKIGGFRLGYEGSQDHDLILRATSLANKVVHIAKILYHWRAHQMSAAGNFDSKPYAIESGKRAVQQSLIDNNIKGIAVDGIFLGSFRAKYNLIENYKIAIVIQNRDKVDMLKTCIDSIVNQSTYKNYEIIIVENSSCESRTFGYYDSLKTTGFIKIIEYKEEYNYSAMNNLATMYTDAEYYVFLNNNIKVISPEWMECMLEHAQRKDVGVVGAKLLYADDTIQHVGVVVGMSGLADHVCKGFSENELDVRFSCKYLADAIRNTSAVTGACMMMSKGKFLQVNLFNEDFDEYGGDIEICLKMLKAGFVNVYTPYSVLYHYENTAIKNTEINKGKFEQCYKSFKEYFPDYDEYYNRNFDYKITYPVLLREKHEANY